MESERFIDFLSRKNIDASVLKASESLLFEKWRILFRQMHEESFVMQEKFRLNPIRRKYPKTRFPAS